MEQWLYLVAADTILVVHFLFVAFVVGGLVLVFIGHWRGWRWIYSLRFRVLHLVAIGYVVLQSWLGAICPLTLWEMQLRGLAGDMTYEGSFVAYWLHRLLFFEAPAMVFVVAYSAFGALVVASWYWIRPRR
ncbi:MAG: DUF2784 domain-containing protein [Gammaproteobacteria bacterium]|nr:DUF2784 domain-containing protein [Gammaproteobacteria bacterium]